MEHNERELVYDRAMQAIHELRQYGYAVTVIEPKRFDGIVCAGSVEYVMMRDVMKFIESNR